MAVPNLAPNYLGQVKGIRAQRQENEKQRAFESDQTSKNFLRRLGGDVLGTALGIGADLAGTAFRDSLTRDERSAAAGTFYPDDDAMGGVSSAIRQAAESRAATELRPQASFGEAAETGFGRRGIDTGVTPLGGAKAAAVLNPQPAPARAPTPAAPASNPMLTPGLEAQFNRVTRAPVVPSQVAPRGMEAEAPRRPMAAPPSPMAQRPAPMPPRETREAPGGYQPPRMMPSTTAAIARESGYREAIPSLPTDVRGLAQQAQDVRDKRSLDLELLRKQLLWDEEQAKANVASLQARGASATAIAQAKQQEADAKAKAESMRELYYMMGSQQRAQPQYVKGLGPVTPRFGVDLQGSTADGLRADIVPQSPMGRQGGGGRGGGAARGGEEPTGDVLTIVRQNRNRAGDPVGPSQPLRVQEGPSLWRAVASSPVDYGMDAAQATAYREAYRAYNTALPVARKGDPQAAAVMAQAQAAMRGALMSGQGGYRPDLATVREEVGTSPMDMQRTARTDEARTAAEARAEQARVAQERRERAGAAARAIPAVTDTDVSVNEVAQVVKGDPSIGAGFGNYVASVGEGLLDADQFAAAIRGAQPPADLDGPDLAAYNEVKARATEARTRLETERRNRARATVGTAAAAAGMTPEEIAADLEAQGLPIPEWVRGGGAAPARPAPARAPTIQAKSAEELGRKIQAMPGLTSSQKADLYEREAALYGFE